MFGRLTGDADMARASAEADAIAERLAGTFPESNSGIGFNVEPLREPSVADSRTALFVLSGAVILLLLIASANLTNLLLGRVLAGRRDTAVRIALGAGSGRLVRQWTVESLALSIAGGAGGLLFAIWSLQGLLALASSALPAFRDVSIDGRVGVFALATAVAVGLLSGVLPARRALRGDVFAGLRGRGTGEAGAARARSLLAAGEVALATALLIGAGLLTRSFLNLTHVEPGFDANGVVTASIAFGNGRYDDVASQERLVGAVLERIGARGDVERVGAINHLPIGGDTWSTRFARPGEVRQLNAELPSASYRVADAGYFAAMRIPLLRGRTFHEGDDATSPRVALINRSLADAYFPGADPVGTRIRFGGDADGAPLVEIVGIVGDVRAGGLAEPEFPEIFLSREQNPEPWFTFVTIVARSADPGATGRAIAAAVADIDPTLPVFDVRALADVVADDLRGQRLNFLLTALFAGGALILSVIGVYAVITQLTRQRTHEMAVRLALGADPGGVLGLVVRRGIALAAAGVVAGLLMAALIAGPASSLFFGVTAWDAPTYAAVAVLMMVVCAAASAVPAFRAARTDPVSALVHD
jgi:putative ABC transport system permease protein